MTDTLPDRLCVIFEPLYAKNSLPATRHPFQRCRAHQCRGYCIQRCIRSSIGSRSMPRQAPDRHTQGHGEPSSGRPCQHARRLKLPQPLQRQLEAASAQMLQPPGAPAIDFTVPPGEPALVAPDSISWRVFRNPVALFVGGITAVLLELAEPRVRTGVWEHTCFRTAPRQRLQRTGLAAMVPVYAGAPWRADDRRCHAHHAGSGATTEARPQASDPGFSLGACTRIWIPPPIRATAAAVPMTGPFYSEGGAASRVREWAPLVLGSIDAFSN